MINIWRFVFSGLILHINRNMYLPISISSNTLFGTFFQKAQKGQVTRRITPQAGTYIYGRDNT